MAKVEGREKVFGKLNNDAKRYDKASGIVGYTASYAIYVHEDLRARHTVGEAKYLEKPARQLNQSGEFYRLIAGALAKGKTVAQGVLLALLRLQRESQLLVPVDTGNLKASAFTRMER